jgi:hypothetical protein
MHTRLQTPARRYDSEQEHLKQKGWRSRLTLDYAFMLQHMHDEGGAGARYVLVLEDDATVPPPPPPLFMY